jgi:hypothetical protein
VQQRPDRLALRAPTTSEGVNPVQEPRPLLPQHSKKLASSAIADTVTTERGYWSASRKSELEDLGFTRSQQKVPALVIPLCGVTGEVVGYQCRPDEPRWKDGRRIKYETPTGQRNYLDVPPAV